MARTWLFAVFAAATLVACPFIGRTAGAPYNVLGFVADAFGNPVPGAQVTITNLDSGGSAAATTDATGAYIVDLATFDNAYELGDRVAVDAVAGTLTGSGAGVVDDTSPSTYVNVTIVDTRKPSVFHTPPSSVRACEVLGFSCAASDDMQVKSVVMRYAAPGSGDIESEPMARVSGSTWNGTWEGAVGPLPLVGTMNYWFEAEDLSGNVADVVYFSTEITPGQLDRLQISAPSSVAAGADFGVTVSARDACGNLVSDYSGTVAFACEDPYPADIPGAYQFTAADGGAHVFDNLSLYTAPMQTVVAADAVAGLSGAAQIIVEPGAARKLAWLPGEACVGLGVATGFQMLTEDTYGNAAPYGYPLDILLSSSSSNYSFTPSPGYMGENAIATGTTYFDSDNSSAQRTLVATPTDPVIYPGTATVTVLAGSADRWVFDPSVASIAAGERLWLNVSLANATGGEVNVTAAATVDLTTSSSGGRFYDVVTGAEISSVTVQVGSSSSPVIYADTLASWFLDRNYAHFLTASNGSAVLTGVASVTVLPQEASVLLVEGPGTAVAGTVFNLTATAVDAYGNRVLDYVGEAVVALPGSDWQGIRYFTLVDRGRANLPVDLYKAGHWELSVTSGGMWAKVWVEVLNAPASALELTGPALVDAGIPFEVVLFARDAWGNAALDYAGNVTMASTDAYPARLPSGVTFADAEGGVLVVGGLALYSTPLQAVNATAEGGLFDWVAVEVRDTAPPTLALDFYPSVERGGVITIWANATDDVKVEQVWLTFSIDGSGPIGLPMVPQEGNRTAGTYTLNVSTLVKQVDSGDGDFVFAVNATDGTNFVTVPSNGTYAIAITDEAPWPFEMVFTLATAVAAIVIILALCLRRRGR
jgi:hypothetical protein